MVTHEGAYQLWVFGGSSGQSLADFFNDMYYFDFEQQAWNLVEYDYQRSMAIPTPRASHSFLHFPKCGPKGCFYVFGGGNPS